VKGGGGGNNWKRHDGNWGIGRDERRKGNARYLIGKKNPFKAMWGRIVAGRNGVEREIIKMVGKKGNEARILEQRRGGGLFIPLLCGESA